jgi:uncharacterized membrane protein
MYDAMYEKYCNYQIDSKEETNRSGGMYRRGGSMRSMMMDMMSTMKGIGMKRNMNDGPNSMSQCMDMMFNKRERSEEIGYATNELMDLFKDWCGHVEDEIVSYVKEIGNIDEDLIADKFHLSKESVSHLLQNLEKTGRINPENIG